MKKILLFAVLLMVQLGFGQKTWNGSSSTNWNTNANWTPSGRPVATDNVRIPNGVPRMPTISTNSAVCNNLTVDSGATLTVDDENFTVSGTTSISGILTHTSTTNVKFFVGLVTVNTGGTWTNTINEAVTFRGGIANNGTFTAGTGTQTFDTNAQAISGNVTMSNVAVTGITLTNNGILTVSTALSGTGSLTNSATRTLTIGGTSSITTLTNEGTMNVGGSGAITTALANFTNTGTLNLNGTGAITGITNNAGGTVNLIDSGTITSFNNATATSQLNISDLTVPTITTLTTTSVGNTVNYNGAGDQTVKATTYSNLTLSVSGAKTFGGATTVNNNLSIDSGVVANLGTFTHSTYRLFLGGAIASNGSWGSTSSIATNKNDTYFASTSGIVNVTNSTCTAYQASIKSSDSACNTVTPGSVNLKVTLTSGTGPFTVVYRNEITNAITTVTNYVSDSNILISPLPTQTTPYTLVSVTDAGGCLATLVNAYTSVLFYSIPATPTATTVGVACPNDATGSITITNAYSPASLKFNGVNTNSGSTTPKDSHVDFGQRLLSNRAQFTAEGWIKFDKTKYANRMSLFGQNDVLEFGFQGNKLECWTAGGGSVTLPLTSYPSDNTWHHIAVIGNGTNLRFFIDGVLVATGGSTTTNYGSNTTYTTKIGWGVMDAGGVGLVGEVFNLGFWSRALSVEELQGLSSGFTQYNSKQVGLLAGYSFNEGTGTTITPVGSYTPVATGTLSGATLPVWTDPSVYSWTSAVPGFVTTSNKNLTGLKAGTYNLNISLKGCPKTTSFSVNSTNSGATPPIIGTITQPTCALATGSVALSGLPSSGTWTITATPATSGLTGLTGTNVDNTSIGGLTANTSYTFIVSNGTCSSVASAAAVVNAIPTTATWNGTAWVGTASSTTPPLITQPIVFSGNYTSTSDINGCSCSVTSGNVVINSGHTMTITNAINVTNNASTSLVFNDKSSLVQTTNAINTGAIEYRRISSPMKNFDYTYWSSPVTGQTAKNLSPNTLADKYFRFSGSANDWIFDDGVMIPGVGYIIRVPKPGSPAPDNWSGSTYSQPVAFKGVPNNGNYPFAVGANELNLLGNPYPSAIRADDFITANTSIIYGALYFWTHNTAIAPSGSDYVYTADDYATYNITGGTAGGPLPIPVSGPAPSPGLNTSVPNGFIAAGQSFFVENSIAGSFQFTNAMRVAGNNSQFFKQANTKKTATVEKNRVWLNLTNSKGAFKQLLVGYITGATNDWDNLYDGPTFDGQEFVDFYSVNQGKNLTIQGRALPFVDTDEVPLGYRSTIAGTFDISIDNRDGALANQAIWLEDKKTNTLHELSKGKYTFTAINGVENDRFVLKYTGKTLGTDDNEVADKSLIVSVKNKKITLTSSAEAITQVQLFDLLGRKVYDKSKINAQEWSISNLPSSEQTLIVKTTLANGAISNKKIIY